MATPMILLLVLTIVQIAKANSFRRSWNDHSLDPEFFDIRNDCSSEACISMFPKKRAEELEDIIQNPRSVPQVLTSYHILGRPWQMSCSCETQYDILDLGLGNFPRYLATARCAAKTCFNKVNSCRLIHYKVHILRQRIPNIENDGSEEQQYIEEVALPESFRTKWQMKPMKIAVACVANDGKKN